MDRPDLIERLRDRVGSYAVGRDGEPVEHVDHDAFEAADLIEALRKREQELVEALQYTRAALGDPVPISKRHIARRIDAALQGASE